MRPNDEMKSGTCLFTADLDNNSQHNTNVTNMQLINQSGVSEQGKRCEVTIMDVTDEVGVRRQLTSLCGDTTEEEFDRLSQERFHCQTPTVT